LLSLAVSTLALLVPAAAPAADTPAEQQLDFGVDMARRGLWKEALFRFQQAARLDPGNPRILNNVAVSFEALGLFDEALEVYQKALRVGEAERDLRSNYSQFAEFYQSFRPLEEGDDEPGGEVAAVEDPVPGQSESEQPEAEEDGE